MSSTQTFAFKDKSYYLDRLQTAAKSGLEINVRVTDLASDFESSVTLPNDFDDTKQPVAFYQYDGKYYVLLGMNTVLNALRDNAHVEDKSLVLIPGVLITRHALKRIEVLPNQANLSKQFIIDTFPDRDRDSYQRRNQVDRYNDRPSVVRGAGYFEESDFNQKSSKSHQRNR
jgi:hypothetical protein